MKSKTPVNTQRDSVTKKDIQTFKDEIIQQFHIISEGLMDQIKLLAEGHSGIIQRLERFEEENKHEHLETRALYFVCHSGPDPESSLFN